MTALSAFLFLGVVFTAFFAASYEKSYAIHNQCSDGVDNDGNGKIDYPEDTSCLSPDDDYEGPRVTGNFVAVTDDRDTVAPGDSVVYLITLKQQRDDTKEMDVLFHLPFQANIVSASDGGAVSPGYVRWTNVSVHKNFTRTLQVNVNVSPDVSPGQLLLAQAKIPGMTATDTTLVKVNEQPLSNRYSIYLTDDHEYALPGENLSYKVRVTNQSSAETISDVRLALPYQIYFISASDWGRRDSYNVTWKDVRLAPGETRTFTANVQVDYRTADKLTIRARAYVGIASSLDETIVKIGLPYDAISTSITDNRSSARIGEILTYTVNIRNDSSEVGTNVSVDAGLPHYSEFVSATEGGYFDGTNVRWPSIQIAPKDGRHLNFSIRVRSDAPEGAILSASASADGYIARDTTVVGNSVAEQNQNRVIFRKTANMSEAVPGGTIRYTLYVENNLDHVISDATILDRYDSSYLTLLSRENPGDLISASDGKMEWRVPVLNPGESWQTTYVMSVSRDAENGIELNNVATLRGSDINDISLTERVRTNRAGVLKEFPTTGAEMDLVLGLFLSVVAVLTAGLQRKLSFGKLF